MVPIQQRTQESLCLHWSPQRDTLYQWGNLSILHIIFFFYRASIRGKSFQQKLKEGRERNREKNRRKGGKEGKKGGWNEERKERKKECRISLFVILDQTFLTQWKHHVSVSAVSFWLLWEKINVLMVMPGIHIFLIAFETNATAGDGLESKKNDA